MAAFKAEIEFEVTEVTGENAFDNAAEFLVKIRELARVAREIKNSTGRVPVFVLTKLERIPISDRLGRKR